MKGGKSGVLATVVRNDVKTEGQMLRLFFFLAKNKRLEIKPLTCPPPFAVKLCY